MLQRNREKLNVAKITWIQYWNCRSFNFTFVHTFQIHDGNRAGRGKTYKRYFDWICTSAGNNLHSSEKIWACLSAIESISCISLATCSSTLQKPEHKTKFQIEGDFEKPEKKDGKQVALWKFNKFCPKIISYQKKDLLFHKN